MSTKTKLNRRQFLQVLGAGSTALLVAACAQPAPAPAPAAKAEPTKAAAVTQPPAAAKAPEPTKAPAAKEPLTFTYWMPFNGVFSTVLKHYGEITAYKETEKQTGVHIEFQHPATGQEAEQFNLLLASGKYPDMIEWDWLNAAGGPTKYLKDGVILRLNDLVAQKAPNLKKVLDDHPDWKKMVVTDAGDMYVFPFLRGDPFLLTYAGPFFRKDWLDKSSLPVPTTVDEWHTALRAFKEKDPNGNGKSDELPFTSWLGSPTGVYNNHALIGAWGITMGYYQDQGTVKYGPLQPEFGEFLKTMAGWYQEGLVDPDFPAMDLKMFDAKMTGSLLGSGLLLAGSGIGRISQLMAGKEPASFRLAGVPYPVLKKGEKPRIGQKQNNYPGAASAAITTACKRPQEAAAWLDFKYGPEGHMLWNFGVEGLTYKMENGYPKYTDEILKNSEGLPVTQAMGRHFLSVAGGPFVQDRRYFEQYLTLPEQREAVTNWMQPTNEMHMPPVSPTQEESKKYASVMNDVNTRFNEAVIKVLTGAEPVNNWDKVTAQLKQMGIEDALKIQQAALERYNKR